jgi:hypothetical protein
MVFEKALKKVHYSVAPLAEQLDDWLVDVMVS